MLPADDLLAIHDVIARYGHLMDEGEFDRLGEVFTDDVTYDATDFDLGVWHGIGEVIAGMRGSTSHPLAHHSTNVVIGAPGSNGDVPVVSKGIGVGQGGRVGSVTYDDIARRGHDGWRIARRVLSLRKG
jgi:hypothetical protein